MSFFTKPSQRKRNKPAASSSAKRQKTASRGADAGSGEEIASSDYDSDGRRPQDDYYVSDEDDSGHERETAAEKRLRLAQRYIDNIRTEVDETGFDAAEVDRDIIAERLKEDSAVSKGRVYRFVSDGIDVHSTKSTFFRTDGNPVYAVDCRSDYIYTARKDGSVLKWQAPQPDARSRRPVKKAHTKGRMVKPVGSARDADRKFVGHEGPILSIALSPSGLFLATGGKDKKIVIWYTPNMKPLRAFTHHRGPVTSLAFKLNDGARNLQNKSTAGETLYSASLDRSVKVWAVDKLTSAYVETLFGHQDSIYGLDAIFEDRCLTVGSRDRTARLWKVAEETQLVFRSGGTGAIPKPGKAANAGISEELAEKGRGTDETSTDSVALIDNELFLTGGDNGSISLWSTQKKKPVFTYPLAHGRDRKPTPDEYYLEQNPPAEVKGVSELPRGITALKALPLSDFFVSGSWDGAVRAWKLRSDRKGFVPLGPLGPIGPTSAPAGQDNDSYTSIPSTDSTASVMSGTALDALALIPLKQIPGIVNDLALYETGPKGRETITVVAAIGKEHRLFRRISVPGGTAGDNAQNGSVLFEIPRRV